ncbi:MAG: glycine dehydrogenase (aminomethyl-transferring), partial [Prochlorococcus sp.]
MTLLEQRPVETSSSQSSPFWARHIGPSSEDQQQMLLELGHRDWQTFIEAVVPPDILDTTPPRGVLPEGCGEEQAIEELRVIAATNQLKRSLIGLGYYGTATPALIQRQVLENPAWYTAYTPYQAEISQGRLETLFNFQTLISELTGLAIANASLLDEGTAAAEAMSLSFAACKRPEAHRFLVDAEVLPQTLAVLKTRAEPLGINLEVAEPISFRFDPEVFGVLLQLPGRSGRLWDPTASIRAAHQVGALVTVAIDPLAQVLIAPVGDLGADIAVGSVQRFGVPVGFGGPHAAFFAVREAFKRQVPGRLVGQSVDAEGQPALRLALQTREQHIRRDKATSNICTAQVLLAVMATFYAIHHGPDGLTAIARRVLRLRAQLERGLVQMGYPVQPLARFDTVEVICPEAPAVHQAAALAGFNLRLLPIGVAPEEANGFGISFDELSTDQELGKILQILAEAVGQSLPVIEDLPVEELLELPLRQRPWLQQSVFHLYRSETELLRYIQRLVS